MQHWCPQHDGLGWLFLVHVESCTDLKSKQKCKLIQLFITLHLDYLESSIGSDFIQLAPGAPRTASRTVPDVLWTAWHNFGKQSLATGLGGQIPFTASMSTSSITQIVDLLSELTGWSTKDPKHLNDWLCTISWPVGNFLEFFGKGVNKFKESLLAFVHSCLKIEYGFKVTVEVSSHADTLALITQLERRCPKISVRALTLAWRALMFSAWDVSMAGRSITFHGSSMNRSITSTESRELAFVEVALPWPCLVAVHHAFDERQQLHVLDLFAARIRLGEPADPSLFLATPLSRLSPCGYCRRWLSWPPFLPGSTDEILRCPRSSPCHQGIQALGQAHAGRTGTYVQSKSGVLLLGPWDFCTHWLWHPAACRLVTWRDMTNRLECGFWRCFQMGILWLGGHQVAGNYWRFSICGGWHFCIFTGPVHDLSILTRWRIATGKRLGKNQVSGLSWSTLCWQQIYEQHKNMILQPTTLGVVIFVLFLTLNTLEQSTLDNLICLFKAHFAPLSSKCCDQELSARSITCHQLGAVQLEFLKGTSRCIQNQTCDEIIHFVGRPDFAKQFNFLSILF